MNYLFKQLLVITFLLIKVNVSFGQKNTIDLSGTWNITLDSLRVKESNSFLNGKSFATINLPGTTDEAKYGKKHIPGTLLTYGKSEIWGLSRNYSYIGKAWYQKTIYVPVTWKGKEITLFLERCMWQTKVWVNGNYIGENHSLCSPHKYNLSSYIKTGENKILLSVDNSPYVNLGSWSHGYSPGIQTIWNGVIGDIKLIEKDNVFLNNVNVYPSYKNQTLIITGNIIRNNSHLKKGHLEFVIRDKNNKQIIKYKEVISIKNDTSNFKTKIELNNKLKSWDEFAPNLYSLEVNFNSKKNIDNKNIKFGLRDIEAHKNKFVINGNVVFMRGEHDAGSFPLTGYPSMKKTEWLRIFNIGKEHGFNHWRFHSWCPPEAAFEAADEVGIYLQPELTLFSQDWEHTLVGTSPARDEFLFEELKKVLDTYGNHPSFILMCMGNELRGDHKVLEKWVDWGKRHDPRHLYIGTTNLEAMGLYKRLKGDDFQVAHAGKYKGKRVARRMFNYFNSEIPNTYNDYRNTLQYPFDQWPIISHEVGQWTVYPDFSEIKKYTGVLSPRNLLVFQSRLKQRGMLEQAHDFLKASGKLSSILYKEEMERLLRTSGMGGYQLLDLRDYQAQGSALVGMLNAFWESKGIISADEFRQSNNAVTLLLKMKKRIWLNDESFNAELVVPNYGAKKLNTITVDWKALNVNNNIISGQIKGLNVEQGKVDVIGNISFDLKNIKKATKLKIHIEANKLGIENNYDIWVYPKNIQDNNTGIIISTKASPELLNKIKNGANVLLVPSNGFDSERTQFTTPFWSTILFNYQVKTMGILCNPENPIFDNFPTDYYSNWQWWYLLHNAHVARLNQTNSNYKPIVQVIDHPVRNDKLGAIVETKIGKGKLLVCTLDILNNLSSCPVARQLKYSILKYMSSDKFNPIETKGIKEAFFNYDNSEIKYNKITASSENSEHPIFFAFDKKKRTWWQNQKNKSNNITIHIELNRSRYITGCSLLSVKKNNIKSFKVYISDTKKDKGNSIIIGDKVNKCFKAVSWDNGFTIQKGKKGKYIDIELKTITDKPFILNEIKWMFGD